MTMQNETLSERLNAKYPMPETFEDLRSRVRLATEDAKPWGQVILSATQDPRELDAMATELCARDHTVTYEDAVAQVLMMADAIREETELASQSAIDPDQLESHSQILIRMHETGESYEAAADVVMGGAA